LSTIPLVRFEVSEQPDMLWRCVGVCERLGAAALLLALSPLLIGIAGLIVALSGRSPLIAHRRVGRKGSELWLLKFRTMWDRRERFALRKLAWAEYIDDCEGPGLKGPDDARVKSRFARLCRRHSIDELPQLLQVAIGKMSLVGPRPVTRRELEQIYGADAGEVIQSKPGMAGLWQVSGRNRLSRFERRVLDLKLVRTRSVKLYLAILIRTVPEVLKGTNSW